MTTIAPCHPRRHHRRSAAALVALLGLLGGCAGAGYAERPADQSYSTQAAVAEQLRTFEPTPVDLRGGDASPAPAAAATRQSQPTAANAHGAGPVADPTQALYHLNPQDMLGISVWREEELQRQAAVQPDGSISFPLIGQVAAAGRTVNEVQAEITRRIDRFIPDAVVTVELLDARGNKIYVMGEVNRPGEYQLSAPLTVVQAIGLAGGFTQYAATDRIRVLRKAGGEASAPATIDYDRIASGRDGATNLELNAGDTIIVPEQRLFSLF